MESKMKSLHVPIASYQGAAARNGGRIKVHPLTEKKKGFEQNE